MGFFKKFRLLKPCPSSCCEQSSPKVSLAILDIKYQQDHGFMLYLYKTLILHDYAKMQTACNRMEEISHCILGLKNKSKFKISH